MNLDEGEAAAGTSSPTDAATSKNLKSEKKGIWTTFPTKEGKFKSEIKESKSLN